MCAKIVKIIGLSFMCRGDIVCSAILIVVIYKNGAYLFISIHPGTHKIYVCKNTLFYTLLYMTDE